MMSSCSLTGHWDRNIDIFEFDVNDLLDDFDSLTLSGWKHRFVQAIVRVTKYKHLETSLQLENNDRIPNLSIEEARKIRKFLRWNNILISLVKQYNLSFRSRDRSYFDPWINIYGPVPSPFHQLPTTQQLFEYLNRYDTSVVQCLQKYVKVDIKCCCMCYSPQYLDAHTQTLGYPIRENRGTQTELPPQKGRGITVIPEQLEPLFRHQATGPDHPPIQQTDASVSTDTEFSYLSGISRDIGVQSDDGLVELLGLVHLLTRDLTAEITPNSSN
jgi:hypothetical protein